jgi:hypothetical protein
MENLTVTVWSWFGEDEVELHPGQLDDAAELAFSSGQCHALALAIHELRPDWEIGGLQWQHIYPGENPADEDFEGELPDHVVVRNPDTGELLDVAGWDVRYRWADDFRPLDPEYIENGLTEVGYLQPNLEVAREFAPLVLQAYEA